MLQLCKFSQVLVQAKQEVTFFRCSFCYARLTRTLSAIIVLTFRVAYLVIEKQIYPNQIVVVTFTNKAANEMKERLLNLIGEVRTNQLLIGTFHSICCRLLRKHSAYADLDPKFTICDTEQRFVFSLKQRLV